MLVREKAPQLSWPHRFLLQERRIINMKLHLRGTPLYSDFSKLWEKAYYSNYFKAKYDTDTESKDWSLSERQLFPQSNGRLLLGQDTLGRLHFLCTPNERIYAVPSGGNRLGGQFEGHIGQYYQNDTALLLGKMRYEVELNSGALLQSANSQSITEYVDYYLPLTTTVYPEMTIRTFSFAPILERDSVPTSRIHPLPGPAAAFFCMEIINTSGCTLSGKIRLSFDQKFVNQFEHYGERFEDFSQVPYKSEWNNKLLILWRPEACAAVQLLDGIQEGEPENPRIYRTFSLKPGESLVSSTIIALTPSRDQIHENLGIIYQHTALEWINTTSQFWKERLGTVSCGIREKKDFGEKYKDMHIRFLIDNFNCLSFDRKGNLLTNWQGAPSHSLSRLWGIDITPDVVSVMYAIPEVGPSAIEYLLQRNRPRFSLYDDHSIFFFISPIIISGKYLELTGDEEYFREHSYVTTELKKIYSEFLRFKHKDKVLFSSHYASDLIVFRKYDYGANAQCYFALRCWEKIQKAIGEDVQKTEHLIKQMEEDLRQTMEGIGPFGRQITGGSNLDEDADNFYIGDEQYYYGGEDTATVLAPLYGLFEFDYEPYVNAHRYARSLFIPNYDPEFETLRELHYGMNPSATGCTLKLGGSYTRREMFDCLELLYNRLDESGSLFWWPRAYNKKRCLTRCSQGQGAWVQQSLEQWYGIRLDVQNKTLLIKPQGLISDYDLNSVQIGAGVFDISYHEEPGETIVMVNNRNDCDFEVTTAIREYGAGAEGPLSYDHFLLRRREAVNKRYKTQVLEASVNDPVVPTELAAFKNEKILFAPYGIVMPKLNHRCGNIFLLRFVVTHAEDDWKDVTVRLQVPEGWKVSPKVNFWWNYNPIFDGQQAESHMEKVSAYTHAVFGFYVNLPDQLDGDEKSVMLEAHPFSQSKNGNILKTGLLVEGLNTLTYDPITAILYVGKDEKVRYSLPVTILSANEYSEKFDIVLHG